MYTYIHMCVLVFMVVFVPTVTVRFIFAFGLSLCSYRYLHMKVYTFEQVYIADTDMHIYLQHIRIEKHIVSNISVGMHRCAYMCMYRDIYIYTHATPSQRSTVFVF